jgi:hypothetical protein
MAPDYASAIWPKKGKILGIPNPVKLRKRLQAAEKFRFLRGSGGGTCLRKGR